MSRVQSQSKSKSKRTGSSKSSKTPSSVIDIRDKKSLAEMLNSCVANIHEHHYIENQKILGCGSYGCVYEALCEIKDGRKVCDSAIKIEEYDEYCPKNQYKEAIYQKKAGELGFAPKVFEYGVCKGIRKEAKTATSKRHPSEYRWIIMENLANDYTTMTDYEFNSVLEYKKTIINAVRIYSRLIYSTNIVQGDLSPSNIMIRNDNLSDIKLIDFGEAFTVNTETKKEFESASSFVRLIIYLSVFGTAYGIKLGKKQAQQVYLDLWNKFAPIMSDFLHGISISDLYYDTVDLWGVKVIGLPPITKSMQAGSAKYLE